MLIDRAESPLTREVFKDIVERAEALAFLLANDRHSFLPHSGMIKEAMADLAPFEDKTFLFLSVLFSFIIGNEPPLLLFLS